MSKREANLAIKFNFHSFIESLKNHSTHEGKRQNWSFKKPTLWSFVPFQSSVPESCYRFGRLDQKLINQ